MWTVDPSMLDTPFDRAVNEDPESGAITGRVDRDGHVVLEGKARSYELPVENGHIWRNIDRVVDVVRQVVLVYAGHEHVRLAPLDEPRPLLSQGDRLAVLRDRDRRQRVLRRADVVVDAGWCETDLADAPVARSRRSRR